jgi:26S proteasome regulatory subunit N11
MLEMLQQTGRLEMVVGWYHSHPGFGCWLSGVDINTQQSFEQLNKRSVAVVVDPIQSVKGKFVIDAFRTINTQFLMLGQEPRQTTSNVGHLKKPTIQALIRGLNRHYYSMPINWKKNELEQQMLLNVHKRGWIEGLKLKEFDKLEKKNEKKMKNMIKLTKEYNKMIKKENEEKDLEKLQLKNVGKLDPKKHLESDIEKLMKSNIDQSLGMMMTSILF